MLYLTIFLREHRDEILDVLTIVRSQLESSLDDAAIALRLRGSLLGREIGSHPKDDAS